MRDLPPHHQEPAAIHRNVVGLAAYALISGTLTLIGWFAGLRPLTDWVASGISMFPNAAFAAICLGTALILARLNRRWGARISGILGLIVAFLGGATLFQHFSGVNLGIDTVLIKPTWGTKAAVAPGRMGPPASTAYSLLGIALILIANRRGRRLVPALGISVCAIAMLALMGYLSGADPLFAVARFTGIAMQTATVLLALGLAVVAGVPEYEPMRTLQADSAAGLLARRSLPFVIGLPVVLGWLRVRGQQAGWFDTAMGTSLLMMVLVAMFLGLVGWWGSAVAKYETALRQSELSESTRRTELEALMQTAPAAIWFAHDAQCSRITGNPAAYVIQRMNASWGMSKTAPAAELPQHFDVFRGGQKLKSEELPMQIAGRTGKPVEHQELEFRFGDGTATWLFGNAVPLVDADGSVRGVVATFVDITERKRAQDKIAEQAKALESANARLHGIIFSAMDAVITIDSQQRIVLFNPGAESMFGLKAKEAEGKHIECLIPERFRGSHGKFVEGFGRTGISNRRMGALGAISGLRANSEEFPIEASISQVETGGEKLFTVILRDITERQRAEQALNEAHAQLNDRAKHLDTLVQQRTARLQEAIGELEAFSYSVAHDLRAPLRALQGYAKAVLEETGVSPQGRTYLERIERAALRLDRLTREVLTYSQLSRAEIKLQSVDLDELAREVVEHYPEIAAHCENIDIRWPLLPVVGQESLLTQVLSNLLINACKFVAPDTTPKVAVRTEALGEHVRLWIEDNGIGIDQRHKARLFNIFGRIHPDDKYAGTGIGLAIVKKATERMGGSVGFESEPGKGSRFWIELKKASVEG